MILPFVKLVAGFTGTQEGMNERQLRLFVRYIKEYNPVEFHHGDCVGADAQVHELVLQHLPECDIFIHPPIVSRKRAFCKGAFEIFEPKEYLDRNKDIVLASTRMFVTPQQNDEQIRSGTWSTWRFAKKHLSSNDIKLILPYK